jgi:hypothetical protein
MAFFEPLDQKKRCLNCPFVDFDQYGLLWDR